jgi:hypothetical protein
MVVIPTDTHVRMDFERSRSDLFFYGLTLLGVALVIFARLRGDWNFPRLATAAGGAPPPPPLPLLPPAAELDAPPPSPPPLAPALPPPQPDDGPIALPPTPEASDEERPDGIA